jgi:hypothetical protein
MRRCALAAALFCLVACYPAMAQTSFTVSTGYSDVQFGPHSRLFFNHDGAYVDGDVLWHIRDAHFPLLLGAGISGSGYHERGPRIFETFPDGFTDFTHLYSDVGLFSIEGRAAIPISFGRSGFFVVPQLGMGLLIQNHAIDTLTPMNGTTFLTTDYHTGAAFDIRPGIQAGYSWGWGSAGLEASYMAAWGDFGALGSRALEFRAGVFFRFKF